MSKRSCGSCTKCCEGWLSGEALGHKFYPGKPCHFIAIGKGCSVYAKRPQEPCVFYKCGWISNEDIPEWMKPSDINAIVDFRTINDIEYLKVTEAGSVLDSKVLSWLIQYALTKQLNFVWMINGNESWFGSPEFNQEMNKQINKVPK